MDYRLFVWGLITGWVIEWIIDWAFWRRSRGSAKSLIDASAKDREIAQLNAKVAELERRSSVEKPLLHAVVSSPNLDATTPRERRPMPSSEGKAPDPLDSIEGIGFVFKNRLWSAGVKTFEQLAASDPDDLRDIVKPEPWRRIDPEKWIEAAMARESAVAK